MKRSIVGDFSVEHKIKHLASEKGGFSEIACKDEFWETPQRFL